MAYFRRGVATLVMGLLTNIVVIGITPTHAADFVRLISRIPNDANTLILLDVDAIFRSPKAVTEQWRESYADNFAATPLIIPPNAKRFVLVQRSTSRRWSPSGRWHRWSFPPIPQPPMS